MIKKFSFLLFIIINKINLRFIFRTFSSINDKLKMKLITFSGAHIGKNSFIRSNVFILNPNKLFIGENSAIGSNSEIFNSENFYIGDNVDIGSQLYINCDNHKFDDLKFPITQQGTISKEIRIGSNVWIGARVTILSNVIIEDNIVIGAGSLVNKNLETGFIYAGVPARKIKTVKKPSLNNNFI